jgi:hypothetical protein
MKSKRANGVRVVAGVALCVLGAVLAAAWA